MAKPTLPQLLRDKMHQRDLTPSELSDALRLSRQTTSYLLNGKTRITKNTAPRLARVLGETALWWLQAQAAVDAKGGPP